MGYRKIRKNPLQVTAIIQWTSLTLIFAVVAFFYVYLKVQMVAKGRQIDEMGKQITELRENNETRAAQVRLLTSYEYLERQYLAGYFQMGVVPNEQIVRLGNGPLNAEGLAQVSAALGETPLIP